MYSTITFDLPDLEFGTNRYDGEVIVIVALDDLNVIGDGIVLFDFVSHSVVDY